VGIIMKIMEVIMGKSVKKPVKKGGKGGKSC